MVVDSKQTSPFIVPAPPDLFSIPPALVEEWGEIPLNERLSFPLTRQEIDHLLLGLLRSLEAQSLFDKSMVEWSAGRIDEANHLLGAFRKQNADAQNSIRQFVAGIMASALRERRSA